MLFWLYFVPCYIYGWVTVNPRAKIFVRFYDVDAYSKCCDVVCTRAAYIVKKMSVSDRRKSYSNNTICTRTVSTPNERDFVIRITQHISTNHSRYACTPNSIKLRLLLVSSNAGLLFASTYPNPDHSASSS